MKDKRKKVAAILWLLAIVALNSYVLWKNGKNLVNADDSSELVLASLLSGGNRLYQQRLGLFLGTAGSEYPVDPGLAVPVYGQLDSCACCGQPGAGWMASGRLRFFVGQLTE